MSIAWTAWAESRPPLSPAALRVLRRRWGRLHPVPEEPIEAARLPASRVSTTALAALRAAAGDDAVTVDSEPRARHAGGHSLVDILRRRKGDASAAPDAVVTPRDAAAIAGVLTAAAEHDLAVVPWGGGTSVVGGLDPITGNHRAVVALDLGRLDRLLSVDRDSLTATFQPGIRTPAAEAALAEHGLTLRHLPQSYARASLGGYVVTRSAGQASSGTGRIDDLVVGLRLQSPTGELVLPALPASAAGPDLRRLVLGSEGTLGVLTELTLRVRSLPDTSRYEAWMLPGWAAGAAALREIAQAGSLPDVLRLSDPHETDLSMRLSSTPPWQRRALAAWLTARRVRDACLVVVGFDGTRADIKHRRSAARRRLASAGGVPIGRRGGESWRRHRFDGPAMRDSLLDAGIAVETFETAGLWSGLDEVRRAALGAVQSALPEAEVGCHISHLYATGASLYFTVLFPAGADIDQTIERWQAVKSAVNQALVSAGGTVSHHHAVGTAHRDAAGRDLGGEVGRRILTAVRRELDPTGICNPGKLV